MANIDGTTDNDTIPGTTLADSIRGFEGNDSITASDGSDTVYGGLGDDTIFGGTGTDSLFGDENNDLIIGGSGADTIDGGTGNNTASYAGSAAVSVNLLTGAASGGDALGDSLLNIQNLSGSSNNDTLSGNAVANILTGGLGNDSIFGDSGNDTLIGNGGNDTLNGGLGYDMLDYSASSAGVSVNIGTNSVSGGDAAGDVISNIEDITGSGQNDTLTGSALDNVINGGNGSDSIVGGADDDTLNGGDGNDTLDGGLDSDSMTGGLGNDSYVVDDSGDKVIELADEGTDSVSSNRTYTLTSNVENLTLTGTAVINGTGNGLNNALTGNAMANDLSGGFGNDTISGGDGNDTLDGGTGADSMSGGAGDDTYEVDDAGDSVTEGASAGTDTVLSSVSFVMSDNVENLTLTGSSGISGTGNDLANTITGNSRNNAISGGIGNDTLFGGSGNDTLSGGSGTNALDGGAGNDTYVLADGTDTITELETGGTDTIESDASISLGGFVENLTLTGTDNVNGTGSSLNNVLTGNTGNNSLAGGTGLDTLFGGDGNDTLDGQGGADSMVGGAGDDLFRVNLSGDVVSELSSGGTDTVESTVNYVLTTNVENLTLIGTADVNATGNSVANVVTGNEGDNRLKGMAGNDELAGAAGADTMIGGSGDDTMAGGAGADTYIVNSALDVIVESELELDVDTVETSVTYTLADGLENLVLTGNQGISGTGNSAENTMTGNKRNNVLDGAGGDDSLVGGNGNDTLNGGVDHDTMEGGIGNDTFVVDDIEDVVTEAADEGIDTVESTVDWTLATNFENLSFTGSDDLDGVGNDAANLMTGNSGANLLEAGAANDTMYGGAGSDTLDGGTGNDSMFGGAGDDQYIVDSLSEVLSESSNAGTDSVNSTVTWALGTNFENLRLDGTDAINGNGNGSNNAITGNSANNVLSGAGGNDTLSGLQGNDSLTGGNGADTFVFDADAGADTVSDFSGVGGQGDALQFLDLLTGTFSYVQDGAFTATGNTEARVDGSNLQMDFDGNGTVDQTIALTGMATSSFLSAEDFLFA